MENAYYFVLNKEEMIQKIVNKLQLQLCKIYTYGNTLGVYT